jgi:hypothetical protein
VTESSVYFWSSAASAVMTRIRLGGESILLEASYAVERMDVITCHCQLTCDSSPQRLRGVRYSRRHHVGADDGNKTHCSDLHLWVSVIDSRVVRKDGGIRWKTYRYCGGGKTLLPMLLWKKQ